MAQKRRNGDNVDEISGKEKKKLKVTEARTIAVQPSVSGPSRHKATISTKNSLAGLPAAIDVEKFVEARAFEIDAMHTAMKTASASSTHRAWQTLPRHLRRRAASHDVRRVPLKLRDKARSEMDVARKKALGRSKPKRGKGKGPMITESFLKRRVENAWLETHLWHSKRMHMEDLWGYRLATSPTEKAYRPSHRASVHGSILHDASYYSITEIRGPEEILISLLNLCCDAQGPGPGSKRYLTGSRILETFIYNVAGYPFDLISPLTVMWRPLPPISTDNAPISSDDLPTNLRTVWLKYHPSVRKTVFNTLKEATSRALSNHKSLHGDAKEVIVDMVDLTGQMNVFEITGPMTSQVIKGALSPVESQEKEFVQFWDSLTNLQSSGSVPRGMVVGFKISDPRLKFPPANAKPATGSLNTTPPSFITLPSATLAHSELWDQSLRRSLAKPRFKKKDIDERRSKNDIPGMPVHPVRVDDCIPVLLIQRSIENPNQENNKGIHGWTLIFPAGWAMAFLTSLVHTNTRIAGQLERQTQSYEAGATYFPRDYPFTESYELEASAKEAKEKETWERKPPAKRVNYEKLGTSSPWRIEWEEVLGLPTRKDNVDQAETAFVSAQREPVGVSGSTADTEMTVKPWLLRGSEVPKILAGMASCFNCSAALHSEINRLRLKRGHELLPSAIASDLLQGAVVNVRLSMCSRGTPKDLAEIYIMPDDLLRKWERFLQARKPCLKTDEDHPEELELAERPSNKSALIGRVTTGHFSLARGEGFAVGAIALTRLMDLEHQTTLLHPNKKAPPMLVVVRNVDGQLYRAARLEVLLDA